MDNVRCHYVYDEEEKIVHVDDVSRDTAKSHRYHCISCGAEMIPKLGNLREHHFAHKAACSCNSETYLHKLGKILLKKKWDESPEFYIRYMQRVKCGKYKDCVFYKDNVCEDSMLSEKYDLKELKDMIGFGGSPRASINLALAARSYAFIKRRGYVIPEDVRAVAHDVLRHRIGLTYEAEASNMTSDEIVSKILNKVEVP